MSDEVLKDHLTGLLGKAPSDDELRAAVELRDRFGFDSTDPVWVFLHVMGHYERLAAALPVDLLAAADKAAATLKAAIDVGEARRHEALTKALADGLGKIRDELKNIKPPLQATAPAPARRGQAAAVAVACLLCVGLGGALGFALRTPVPAPVGDAWWSTPAGAAARRFGDLNDAAALMACDGFEKMRVDGGRMYCRPTKGDKIYGWRIE